MVGVSASYAVGAILGKIAYLGGTNALSLLTTRSIAAVLWLALILSIQRVPLTLGAPYRGRAYAIGALMTVQTFGLYYAIELMAAPLAMLTFYTYPILTVLVEAIIGRDPLDRRKIAALVLSFCGVFLTLFTGDLRPTVAGIVWATIGSIAMTIVFTLTAGWFPPGDSRTRTAHTLASTSVLFVLVCLVTGEFRLPTSTSGWVGYLGVCISFPLAVTGMFIAIGKVGPSRVSLLFNFEPIAVVVMSAVILGQALSGAQWIGATMVVGAIVLLQWPRRQE